MIFLPLLPPSGKKVELTDAGRGFMRIVVGWLWALLAYSVLTFTSNEVLTSPIPESILAIVGLVIVLGFTIHAIIYAELCDKPKKGNKNS